MSSFTKVNIIGLVLAALVATSIGYTLYDIDATQSRAIERLEDRIDRLEIVDSTMEERIGGLKDLNMQDIDKRVALVEQRFDYLMLVNRNTEIANEVGDFNAAEANLTTQR